MLLATALVTLVSTLVLAAPPQESGEEATSKPPAAAARKASTTDKDPFQPDERVRRVLAGGEREDGFVPLEGGAALPKMKLKGLVKMRGKPTVASVEVDGVGSFVVRKGEKIVFSLSGRVVAPSASGKATVEMREQIPIALLVKEISRDGVVVELGTLGETLIIR